MGFPERFSDLPEYAFPRLRALLDRHEAGGEVVQMTIGEPRHAPPPWVRDVVAEHAQGFSRYPPNDGTPELLGAISDWIGRRYGVSVDSASRIMVLNGTREGLFNAAIALCPETKNGRRPVVLTPNPFYQVYAVAALALGTEPVYVPATVETGFLPDYARLPEDVLNRVAVAYLCSPSNPQGAIASRDYLKELLALAERYDFRVFADECYSEVYSGEAPPGILEIATEVAADPERVVAFHSLSKRSNMPGLRSGFVAGGPESIRRIKQLRAYAGAPLPLPLQRVAEKIWADEDHVTASRERYQGKFRLCADIFGGIDGFQVPAGGFFLWLPVADGEDAALKLWTETGVRVLPGAYLARRVNGENPGDGFIRVALVAQEDELTRGLTALRDCLYE